MSGANAGPLEWRQRQTDPYEAHEAQLDRRQAQLHTGMPGIIEAYDPATQTATVRPALQRIHTELDGTRKPQSIEAIRDVPVHFPGGGAHTLTFPVKPGDECWIKFSERSIDNWHQLGGTQEPSDWRMHDINDAIVEVGVRSQATKLNNVSATTTQIRSDDGQTVIDLDGAGKKVTIWTGSQKVIIDNAAGKIRMETPRLEVTGDVIDHCDSQGHTAANMREIYNTHTHPGIQPGPYNTGQPNQQQRIVE